MRLLARIAVARDVLDDADTLLAAALAIAPDFHAARFDYAKVLFERHLYQRACEELETLLSRDPQHLDYRALHASARVGLGEHERAIGLYRELLREVPQAADLHLSLAHALKTQGLRSESVDAYHAAIAARPGFGDAYWSLANLKTYRFTDEEIEHMTAAEASAQTPVMD